MSVPPLPPLPDVELASHRLAHDLLAEDWVKAHDVHPMATMLLRRLLCESHANIQPVRRGSSRPLLFPRPRSFLTTEQQRRVSAASAGFDHVTARMEAWRTVGIGALVDASTPLVLHGILETPGLRDSGAGTGLFRTAGVGWSRDVNPLQPPPSEMVPELVDAALDMSTRAPAPGIARAGWLAFTMLTIRPFADGNGRVARMLLHALASSELILQIDWGVAEQFSLDRQSYLDALRAGQQCSRYDPSQLDALPFMRLVVAASTRGAELARARLGALGARSVELRTTGLSHGEVIVRLAVELWGVATLEDLGMLADEDELVMTVGRLVARGALEWSPLPAGRRAIGSTASRGLVAR